MVVFINIPLFANWGFAEADVDERYHAALAR